MWNQIQARDPALELLGEPMEIQRSDVLVHRPGRQRAIAIGGRAEGLQEGQACLPLERGGCGRDGPWSACRGRPRWWCAPTDRQDAPELVVQLVAEPLVPGGGLEGGFELSNDLGCGLEVWSLPGIQPGELVLVVEAMPSEDRFVNHSSSPAVRARYRAA